MNAIQVFAIARSQAHLVRPRHFRSEAGLRRFIVRLAPRLLDLTVLATEYPISTNGEGRIDAIGLDRARNPVIIEFKRAACGTAICQALHYLDWLVRHRDHFSTLVKKKLGASVASSILWNHPRLICLAEEIGEREEAVARQVGQPVELLQVQRLPRGLVLIQRSVRQPSGYPKRR